MRGIFKYGRRFLRNSGKATKLFLTREIGFSEYRTQCRRHYQAAIHEMTRPPVSDRRKAAIRYLNQGIHFYNEKRYAEALAAFEQAVDYDPQYGRAHLYYGNTQYKLHNHEEALASWNCVVRMEPHSESGVKAQEKLDTVRSKEKQTVREIQEHLRRA
ncbi:MAG: tetratricopeptide repeat protein [Candidatus Hydrogenedentes bacterium]|jgi:tetratricopeptide (TPR) repeat protein|nr:tetratricopeptide repeat protein [Candidatus Hydrogenedentota bacterium]